MFDAGTHRLTVGTADEQEERQARPISRNAVRNVCCTIMSPDVDRWHLWGKSHRDLRIRADESEVGMRCI